VQRYHFQVSPPSALDPVDKRENLQPVSRNLPRRAGSKPVDHSITYFNHVCFPRAVLLGNLDKPTDLRQKFLLVKWRVGMGSLILSTVSIPVLKASIHVAGRYSMRREVAGTHGQPTPIISFRTQQLPILYTLVQVSVLEAFAKDDAERFIICGLDPQVHYGIAAVFKAVMVHHVQGSLFALAGRRGFLRGIK
jgi:acyl-CoA oxidase